MPAPISPLFRWLLAGQTAREIGCAASHRLAIERVLQSGAAFGCVLEDMERKVGRYVGFLGALGPGALRRIEVIPLEEKHVAAADRRTPRSLPVASARGGGCRSIPLSRLRPRCYRLAA